MTRKRRRHYKLLEPLAVTPELPARVRAIVTLVQWGFWGGLAGVMVAFALILTLFGHWRLSAATWLRLWPASERLLATAASLSPTQASHLAVWLTLENGLLYAAIGLLLGGAHVAIRALRRRSA
jgi:hypothetical protein